MTRHKDESFDEEFSHVSEGIQETYEPTIEERRDVQDHQEELAAEFTAEDKQSRDEGYYDQIIGWFALILSVISFFIMPIILGAAGIIVGIYARHRGASILGNIAIVLGVLSIIIRLFVFPFL